MRLYPETSTRTRPRPSPKRFIEGRVCPKCGSPLEVKNGRYGKFIGCSGYPKCKHIEPLERPEDTGRHLPQVQQGNPPEEEIPPRQVLLLLLPPIPSATTQDVNEPIAEACPKCGWPVLTLKTTKRSGTEKVCPQKECGYHEPVERRRARADAADGHPAPLQGAFVTGRQDWLALVEQRSTAMRCLSLGLRGSHALEAGHGGGGGNALKLTPNYFPVFAPWKRRWTVGATRTAVSTVSECRAFTHC